MHAENMLLCMHVTLRPCCDPMHVLMLYYGADATTVTKTVDLREDHLRHTQYDRQWHGLSSIVGSVTVMSSL